MSRRAIAALLCLLPFAAEAQDRVLERDDWIVEHVRADPLPPPSTSQ